jgi:hypothetical protein
MSLAISDKLSVGDNFVIIERQMFFKDFLSVSFCGGEQVKI